MNSGACRLELSLGGGEKNTILGSENRGSAIVWGRGDSKDEQLLADSAEAEPSPDQIRHKGEMPRCQV